jgi:tRNA U34 5-methylaminomethyl-2-thiouridine-forming methyltransferase MnmC
VNWSFVHDDFPAWLKRPSAFSALDAIMFDAFSPARNPAMWTLPLFTSLFRQLNTNRPCNFTTYSRSTMLRVTLLLAGFFVGRGVATGLKEETTVAANSLSLLDEPLDHRWLERARRSDSAEPLQEAVYRQAKLTDESRRKLEQHPQFCHTAAEPN